MSREEKTLRKLNEIVCSYNQSHKTILIDRSLMEMFVDYMIEELDRAREEGRRGALEQIQRFVEDEMLVITRDGEEKEIEGGKMTDIMVEVLVSSCEAKIVNGVPKVVYSGKEIEEAIRMMKEEYITELFGEGIITFWGKDFDGKETLTVMFKGDVARFYYNELSKLNKKK